MADEKLERQKSSSTIDRQNRRDDILEKLYGGEVSLSQAEREAREHDLGPLTTEADPSVFDPMAEVFWTPLMAVAWITFRDVDRVRWATDEYRMQWTYFKPHKKGPKTTYEIIAYSAANRRHLDTNIGANRKFEMTVDEAIEVLTRALRDGRVEATGIRRDEGERKCIQPMHWTDLRLFENRESQDTVGSKNNHWRAVRLSQKTVISIWQPPKTTIAAERTCEKKLIELMKASPDKPIPKERMRQDHFPDLSKRSFERAYTKAVMESGATKWSASGRRSKNNRRDIIAAPI